jgi:uncharacterized secreted protein with C-terminal beta-propeller domain
MKRYELLIVAVIAIIVLLICVTALRAEDKKPESSVTTVTSLTTEQKLTLRTAQVDMLVATQNLVNSNEWRANEAAKAKLSAAVAKVFTDLKLKQDEWEFDANLNLVKKPTVKK